ncbi:MAG: radical SAM protein [Ruminiclostridium sp.]|nr:radical SAM protein [Ruminiclostridium sp.]
MKRFKKVYVEITGKCNLSCDFCPGSGRREGFMDRELFGRILDEVGGFTGQLYFHVLGEPLLHPELGAFLDMCYEHGIMVNITTNGTLIRSKADTLLSKPALRQVNFSLHSFESNYRDNHIDKYLDSIFDFIERSKKCKKLLIGLRLWNISDKGKNGLNRHILGRIEKQFNIGSTIMEEITPVNGIKLFDNVFLHIAGVFDWPDTGIEDKSSRGFCYGLRDQAAILADGTVVPCCLDSQGAIKLGNIRGQSFADIIRSDRARNLYEGFSRREAIEPLCRKCGYRMRFGRD